MSWDWKEQFVKHECWNRAVTAPVTSSYRTIKESNSLLKIQEKKWSNTSIKSSVTKSNHGFMSFSVWLKIYTLIFVPLGTVCSKDKEHIKIRLRQTSENLYQHYWLQLISNFWSDTKWHKRWYVKIHCDVRTDGMEKSHRHFTNSWKSDWEIMQWAL